MLSVSEQRRILGLPRSNYYEKRGLKDEIAIRDDSEHAAHCDIVLGRWTFGLRSAPARLPPLFVPSLAMCYLLLRMRVNPLFDFWFFRMRVHARCIKTGSQRFRPPLGECLYVARNYCQNSGHSINGFSLKRLIPYTYGVPTKPPHNSETNSPSPLNIGAPLQPRRSSSELMLPCNSNS